MEIALPARRMRESPSEDVPMKFVEHFLFIDIGMKSIRIMVVRHNFVVVALVDVDIKHVVES